MIKEKFENTRKSLERFQLINHINKLTMGSPLKLCEVKGNLNLKTQINTKRDISFNIKKGDLSLLNKGNLNSSEIQKSLRNANEPINKTNEINSKSVTLEEISTFKRNNLFQKKKIVRKPGTPTNNKVHILQRNNSHLLTLIQKTESNSDCHSQTTIQNLQVTKKYSQKFSLNKKECKSIKNMTLEKGKRKLEAKLKKGLAFTPKLVNNSEKLLFMNNLKALATNPKYSFHLNKRKSWSFNHINKENGLNLFYNLSTKNLFGNKIQRFQSLFKKQIFLKKVKQTNINLKRKTMDLAHFLKHQKAKNDQEIESFNKNNVFTNIKRSKSNFQKFDLNIYTKFKKFYESKFKKIVGVCDTLNIDIFSLINSLPIKRAQFS